MGEKRAGSKTWTHAEYEQRANESFVSGCLCGLFLAVAIAAFIALQFVPLSKQ